MLKLRKAGNNLYKPLFDTKSKVTEMVSQNLPLGDVAIFIIPISVDPVRPWSVSRYGIKYNSIERFDLPIRILS